MREGTQIGRVLILVLLTLAFEAVFAQGESVFSLLRKDKRLGDEYFTQGRYRDALTHYIDMARSEEDKELNGRIGRCYFELHEYGKAVEWYERADESNPLEVFRCAEAYAALGRYDSAIDWYKKYLSTNTDDLLVVKKVWQLQNAHYLFEDSIHFAVRPVSLNTPAGEMCAIPFEKGVLFMSNQERHSAVRKVDARSHSPFYKLYYAPHFADTITFTGYQYADAVRFHTSLPSGFNVGPVRFFDGETKMVYVSNSREPSADGSRPLQLYFAHKVNGQWKAFAEFPFNNPNYSLSDPAINEEGTVLYFSSDMPGGLGGRDLYRSEFLNGRWTEPLNLGDLINTRLDERFPFLQHGSTLYFSSNGHAGLGGLDVFKAQLTGGETGEPTNLGYPINTHFDEFGISLDSLSTHGYLTSNRTSGGANDDIYEFDMDVQTYPLVITGVVSYKQFSWSDSTEMRPFANARLYLIDNLREITISTDEADNEGHFVLRIPYFSKYKIRVVGPDDEESIVSLEIPKHRKAEARHEIVVVKDPFANDNREVLR